MTHIWHGVRKSTSITPEAAAIRQALADYGANYDWTRMLDLLTNNPELVNSTRPDGKALYAPLHQAAHGGAPVAVVRRLIELGAWRTLANAGNERPVDVARRRRQNHLITILEPKYKRRVPAAVLSKIERHFHGVILGRAESFVKEHALRLPKLEPLLEVRRDMFWFAVPGMYGGFAYQLARAGANAKLVSDSWCRVASGSGQRHEITADGSRLVDEGFV